MFRTEADEIGIKKSDELGIGVRDAMLKRVALAAVKRQFVDGRRTGSSRRIRRAIGRAVGNDDHFGK